MDLKQASLQLFLSNRRKAKNFQYTIPSPDTYPYQWLWDSCFHAIILTHFNVGEAKKEILSLLSKQFDNGLIPHIIYWDKKVKTDFPKINWGIADTSSITQPPMIAYAVWQIYQKDNDRNFIKIIYPKLYHFYKYLLSERDPHENRLIGIMNPDESGEDNSPRFDIPLSLPAVHSIEKSKEKRFQLADQNIKCNFDAPFCMRNFFWVKDVPFNSIMVENLRYLSQIAEKIGKKGDSIYFTTKADEISLAMRKLMFDSGIFWSTYGEDYKRVKVKTWAMFAPLFARVLTQNEAKKLVNGHLLNSSEFWTKYPVPTVSIDEPSFDPKGFWRGPVWIATNWFIYKGLKNYGFYDIAKQIKESSIALIEKSGFREYFDPNTGEGFGAKDFTWGCLMLDMD
ncbi:MAG: trehalase family glycosidase [Candidatus Daviesbacteria bacterium]|nr:trehalase family glycosidase [Candidatus Daviesbacteria bacterium]